MTEKTELEVKELQTEALSNGAVLQVKHESLQDTLWLADNIEKLIDANKKIFTVILKSSHPGDFVSFGKGEKEKVELIGAACERVARDVGISFNNWTEKLETFQDEVGPGFRYVYEADAVFRSRVIRVMSVASSRTKFFGKEDGEFKDVSEVSRDDVQIAARRGIHKEGVKALLGLRHLNRAEVEKYGVSIVGGGGYNFQNRDEKAGEQESVTISVEKVTFKSSKPGDKKEWTKFSVHDSEGGIYSTFDKKIAEEAKLLIGTKKTVTVNFVKSQYGNDIVTFAVNPEM